MKIAVVTVTFHPDAQLHIRFGHARSESNVAILVDNGSSREHLERSGVTEDARTIWLYNDNNLGVASALNRGIAAAFSADADFVVLLDQDSELRPGWRSRVEWAASQQKAEPALFSLDQASLDANLEKVPSCITAGSFLSKTTWQKTGPFVDELFIDYVDHEYAMRVRHLGGSIWRVNGLAALIHQIGIPSYGGFGSSRFELMNSNAFRWFHIGRNLTWLWKGPASVDRRWAVRETYSVSKRLLKCIFFEENKTEKFWSAVRGVFSGLTRQTPIKWHK